MLTEFSWFRMRESRFSYLLIKDKLSEPEFILRTNTNSVCTTIEAMCLLGRYQIYGVGLVVRETEIRMLLVL